MLKRCATALSKPLSILFKCAFVKRKACVTNLLETMDLVTKSLSTGIPVDVVYFDFFKAFDMVPHKRLILNVRSDHLDSGLV